MNSVALFEKVLKLISPSIGIWIAKRGGGGGGGGGNTDLKNVFIPSCC